MASKFSRRRGKGGQRVQGEGWRWEQKKKRQWTSGAVRKRRVREGMLSSESGCCRQIERGESFKESVKM